MQNSHLHGLAAGILGIVVLSPDALIVRLVDSDPATVIAGRALFLAVAVLPLIIFAPGLRRGFRWPPVLIYGATFGVGVVCFPLSIQHTYTANTLGILAAAPILAGVGARFFLREKVSRPTWLAAGGVFLGIVLLVGGGIGGGRALGDGLALATAFVLAAGSIVIRRYPQTAVYPGLVLGGLLAAACMLPFAEWTNLTARNIALVSLNGGVVLSLSFLLIVRASKLLPPPEVNLLFLLETALAPLWVWIVLDEVPPPTTLLAGAWIVSVLVAHSVWTLRPRL